MSETYAVLLPFSTEGDVDHAESARAAAVARWWEDAHAAGTPAGEPTVERIDPIVVDGEYLRMPYIDEDGNEAEAPPMSAWRVEGRVVRSGG